MGCVSSKHLKKHAILEEKSETPSGSRKLLDKTSNSFEDYHRHIVALTSTSYGLLKVDSPKTPEEVQRSTARVGPMNDSYDRLNVLESIESTPKTWNEVNNALQTLKPGFQRSLSIPVLYRNKPVVEETIDVSDIMQGLEEGASSPSLPSQDIGSITPSLIKLQPPPPPPVPERSSTRRHQKFDKTGSYSTSKGLGMPHFNAGFVAHEKLSLLPTEDLSRFSAHAAAHLPGRIEKPYYAEHPSLIMQTMSNGNRGVDQRVLTKTLLVPNENKETLSKERFLCRDTESNLGSKPPSAVSYSTSSRRLKLTLNLEYESTSIADMLSGQDVDSSVGSSARKSIVDILTEPGSPLFDPALLAAYEKAWKELRREDWSIADDTNDSYEKMRLTKETQMDVDMAHTVHGSEDYQSDLDKPLDESIHPRLRIQPFDLLDEFEWKCPPGGEKTVVLYTTTLHGIRKTFEDCNNVRDILKGFSVGIHERDVSMHSTFRNELRELLGGRVSVPSVFIKGRYIGGVKDAIRLHEEGKLSVLLKGLPKDFNTRMCDGCGNMRFVPCLTCSGSCKIVNENKVSRCLECNENGLIQCPICS